MADDAASNLETLRHLNDAGYGFYRSAASVRADDLLARGRATDCLHRADASLALAEQKSRRAIPAPSREIPFPDPVLLAEARALKAVRDRIATLETRLRGAAALPDGDFSALIPTEELRSRLVTLDAELIDLAAAIEAGAFMPVKPTFHVLLDSFEKAIGERAALGGRGTKV